MNLGEGGVRTKLWDFVGRKSNRKRVLKENWLHIYI